METSFVCIIDGTPGTGKSTALAGMRDLYGENCTIIPEGNQFIPQLDSFKQNKGSLFKLIDAIRAAETYRWHLVEEAKQKKTPLIFLDTSIQHSLTSLPLGLIAKLVSDKKATRTRERNFPEPGKTAGIKFVKPDHTIFLHCPSPDIQKNRLESRGSFDHASYVPTKLYQTAYKIGYRLLSPFLQKTVNTINTQTMSHNDVLYNITDIIYQQTHESLIIKNNKFETLTPKLC